MLATMKPLTAEHIGTYTLHPSICRNGRVSTRKRAAKPCTRKAHEVPTIRAAVLPSPSPSEERFETPLDSTISKPIPRLEPFTQSRIVRGMRPLSLIEKAEHSLSDYCLAVEGDEAFKCWDALSELEKMKEECKIECNIKSIDERPRACHPLERIEHLVRQSGGVSSLIDNLLMRAKAFRMQKPQNPAGVAISQDKAHTDKLEESHVDGFEKHEFPEPGCLPKTEEELQLEQSALMPESSFTRLLRRRSKLSSWFSKPPEHETD